MDKGLVHIYCGDGKGKTTAALGLVVRALGRGYRIVFIQFLKWQETGEVAVLRALDNVTVLRSDRIPHKFTWKMSEEECRETAAAHNDLFERAVACCGSERCLLVLDELVGAYDKDLVDKGRVLDFLRGKPDGLEVVLTGRNPAEELVEAADYISEIHKVRHPIDRNIRAREGIEY